MFAGPRWAVHLTWQLPAPSPSYISESKSDPRRVSESDRLTKSAGGKQDAFVAFLPNSFHTGEKERGKKTEAERLSDKKTDMTWEGRVGGLCRCCALGFLGDGMFW